MSFLLYMMGRGLSTTAAAKSAGSMLDAILERRRMSAGDGDRLAARLALDAEIAGDTDLAAERYKSALAGKAPRWAIYRAACVAAARGQLVAAAEIYGKNPTPSVGSELTRAELLLASGNHTEAAPVFRDALGRLLSPGGEDGSPVEQIEAIVDDGTALLGAGRYVLARRRFEQALSTLDIILTAQAGWIVCRLRDKRTGEPRTAGSPVQPLVPLVKLADALLRQLARAALASSLADSLRSRSLRDDLAAWATGSAEVGGLFRNESRRIIEIARNCPDHADAHYRLGLIHRALGELPAAAEAFCHVLSLHPCHRPAALRLAATLHETGRDDRVEQALSAAFTVSPATLRYYYHLGLSTLDARRFDAAAAALAAGVKGPQAIAARANLALALADLGLLDPARSEWRHPQAEASAS